MTNKKLWMGMPVLILVFGMAVVGCDDGSTENGREETIPLPPTIGEFTFTDIPSNYNGKFARLIGEFSTSHLILLRGFMGATRNTSNMNAFSTQILVKIENGTVKIPLYTAPYSNPPYSYNHITNLRAYTGNDSVFVTILIYNTEIFNFYVSTSHIASAIFGTQADFAPESLPITFPVQFTNGKVTKSNNDADVKLSN